MKTFIASLLIFALLCVFVGINSAKTSDTVKEILSIAESLPDNEQEFEKNAEETRKKVEELYSLWDKKIDGLAYIMSYDMLDRADEAVISLYSAYSISDTEDFILARAKLCDSLKRLLMFCGFSIKSLA